MKQSYRTRSKIIDDEIIEEKWNRIYVEKNIKNLIKKRYSNGEIKLDSSYIYEKMKVLLDNKIYLELRWMSDRYVASLWYINVFELHKKLTEVIRIYHLLEWHKNIYTKEEKEYIKNMN